MNEKIFLAKVSDNMDPDKLHRVRVTFTDEKEIVSDWIPVMTLTAGNDSGMYSIPDNDEQVLVASLGESGTRFCVLGSIWSNKAEPPKTGENTSADLNQNGKNAVSFIKTKSGSMFILDDTKSSEKIQLIAADKKTRIEFLQADEAIRIESNRDIKISAKSKIQISAEELEITAKKKVSLSSDELNVKSSKDLSVKANKDISLKGSGIALN